MNNKKRDYNTKPPVNKKESHPFSEELSDGGVRDENIKKLNHKNHCGGL